MAFKWEDYLIWAEGIHSNFLLNAKAISEAELRTSVSRSYYAAFNIVRSYGLKSNSAPAFNIVPYFILRKSSAGRALPQYVKHFKGNLNANDYREANDHQNVYYSLLDFEMSLPKPQRRNLARKLQGSRTDRNECDYESVISKPLGAMVSKALQDAREIVDYINGLP